MPDTKINAFGVVYETNVTDRHNAPSFGSTVLLGFSVSFEMSNADKRYFETTSIKAFGIEFEDTPLYCEEIYERRM